MDKEVVHLNRLYPIGTISRPIKKVTKAFWQYKQYRGVIVAAFASCVFYFCRETINESDKLSRA